MTRATAIAKIEEPESRREGEGRLRNILQRHADAAAQLFIVAVALFMAWHTWAHWGSIESDCGRELYVPLEILRGKLLYRDIWYDYGPLAPYTQAALIAIFGRHLDVFYGFGIALGMGCALLLYRIGSALKGRAVGLTASIVALLGGFDPKVRNYPFPYAYAAPLGLLLGLACAWLVICFLLGKRRRSLMLASLAAALALLCKPEIGAAAYVMLAFGVAAAAADERSWRTLWNAVVACVPGGALWVSIYGWFLWKVGPKVLLFENWINTPGTYYARTFGARCDRMIGLRLGPLDILITVLTASTSLVVWYVVGRSARLKATRLSNLAVAGWALLLACLALTARYTASKPLSFLLLRLFLFPLGMYLIGCGLLTYTLVIEFRSAARSQRALAEMTFALFALLLAVRVMVMVAPTGYSLFYGAPLFLIFVLVLARLLDAAMRGIGDYRRRRLINLMLALETLLIAILVIPGAGKRTAPFQTAWGTIYLKPAEAAGARKIFDFTMEQKRKGRAVVFLAELPMMYAFTGTEAPSMWYSVVPGYVPPDKEKNYISDLEKAKPEYVLITDHKYSVYGVPYFGLDYDRRIYRWIEKNYRVVGQLGDFRRVKDAPLAALIYERSAGLPSAVSKRTSPDN